VKSEAPAEKGQLAVEPPKVRDSLKGLPPALIEKILAKEKAKQLRQMTESDHDRKERLLLDELVTVSRY
jgi:hypothetical protein